MITLEKMRTKSICYAIDTDTDTFELEVFYTATAGVSLVELSQNLITLGEFSSVEDALNHLNTKVESQPNTP
jgi:hypothetical protein